MFSGGVLLGSYDGSAVNGQKITIEAPASGPPLVGRYVLLQKDNAGLSGEDRQLHVAEFEAFGGCDTYFFFSHRSFYVSVQKLFPMDAHLSSTYEEVSYYLFNEPN